MKRMMILSFDAFGGEDYTYLKELPAMRDFFRNAAVCTNVSTVYPSVTYACHTSIITGKYPKNHGVINNTFLQPNRESPDWYWQRKYIKGETLYDLAIEKGMKVASLLWPATAKSKIHYNLPEIFANRKWDNQIFCSLRNGSPLYQFDLLRRFGHLLDGINQPALDDFVTESLIHTIKTKSPELIMAHFVDLDSHRHAEGTYSEAAYQAMDRFEKRFIRITDALKEQNLYKDTAIVLLGDHTQIDVHKEVRLNKAIHEAGFLEVKNGKIVDWQIIAKSCGGSSYIYLHPKHVEKRKELQSFIFDLQKNPDYGIERVYTLEEATKEGADPNCLLMIEGVEGVHFTDVLSGSKKKKKADHGYHPNKPRFKTFFSAAGPGIMRNVEIESMSLVDIAPTLAKLLDLELKNPDGQAIKEVFL